MAKYVFDLDGTICTQEKSGEYHLAQPYPRMIDKINGLYMAGNRIVIFTARGMKTFAGRIDLISERYNGETRDWLNKNGVLFHELIFGKPAADIYIDDKGVNAHEFLEIDL